MNEKVYLIIENTTDIDSGNDYAVPIMVHRTLEEAKKMVENIYHVSTTATNYSENTIVDVSGPDPVNYSWTGANYWVQILELNYGQEIIC